MPRIRTVKPEFWEDEVLGLLPRDARLLFVATFNMADDEGLLRWTPAYIKAQAFMYDDDLAVPDVAKLMQQLADAGLIFPFVGGVARQQMACVVNFRKHQKINRPQKSKMPAPSLQNATTRRMYARRDGWTCQLCGGGIPERPVVNDSHNLSIDHIRPQSQGGSDHPSNVRATHQACSEGRRECGGGEFVPPRSLAGLHESLEDSLNGSVNDSLNGSVNKSQHSVTNDPGKSTQRDFNSVNHSLTEGKGREGKGKERNYPPTPAAEPPDDPAAVDTGRPLPDRMTDAFLARFSHGNSYKARQVRGVVADTLANDTDPDELWRALIRLGETSKPVTANTLQFAFSDIRKNTPSNVIQLANGQALSGTDARVAAHSALTEQLRALEAARETS
ncbi:HNH endonuclease [Streptomyces sp. H27-D2]|uniref:HNH endonuclease n=1 Tax=Streptomyces sp. H27-D2 TaxID=3046304 RepID=UPI002DBF6B11|nr:HNH endonuclease [Streptomyces sp. H27-D2]MEC4016031.1 HNH endonuclease [Streptomyces sp. H27-D2]